MYGHSLIEFLAKRLAALAVCITLGAIDAVRQFHNCHSGKSRGSRSTHSFDALQDLPKHCPYAFHLQSGCWSRGSLPCGRVPRFAVADNLFPGGGNVSATGGFVAMFS